MILDVTLKAILFGPFFEHTRLWAEVRGADFSAPFYILKLTKIDILAGLYISVTSITYLLYLLAVISENLRAIVRNRHN